MQSDSASRYSSTPSGLTIQQSTALQRALPQNKVFSQACRAVGADEGNFFAVLRLWVNKSDAQREYCYGDLYHAAQHSERFLAELRLREERLRLLHLSNPLKCATLHAFRQFLKSDMRVSAYAFHAYLYATLLSDFRHLPLRAHVLALLTDYPSHPNLLLAITRHTQGFPPELCREIRDISRASATPPLLAALVHSSTQLQGYEALRDVRRTTAVVQNSQQIDREQRIKLCRQIVRVCNKLDGCKSLYPTALLRKDAMRLQIAVQAGVEAPQIISDLELEEAIALQNKVHGFG